MLILPGWLNSGPGHWQSNWEQRHGYRRVEQHDWQRPLRGDWLTRLEDTVLACDEAPVLVAHSLGCILVAAWASHSSNRNRVRGALLVAPGDAERADLREQLPTWAPISQQALPFAATLVASHNDSYCTFEHAAHFAETWGAQLVDLGNCGHINADSSLGDWPFGHALLTNLMKD